MYDFRFNTNNMLVYHTEKETPEFPFYGKIYTTGEVLLRGGNEIHLLWTGHYELIHKQSLHT